MVGRSALKVSLVMPARNKLLPAPKSGPADLRIYFTDHRRVSAVNGWSPKRDAVTTLTDIYDWIRSQEPYLRQIL